MLSWHPSHFRWHCNHDSGHISREILKRGWESLSNVAERKHEPISVNHSRNGRTRPRPSCRVEELGSYMQIPNVPEHEAGPS